MSFVSQSFVAPVVLINKSTVPITQWGFGSLTLADLAAALQTYVNTSLNEYWGFQCNVSVGTKVGPGQWAIYFVDDNSSAPGAEGFHDSLNDEPYGQILVKTTLQAGDSVSVCACHELIEMLGNSKLNNGCQQTDNSWFIRELCDAVEDTPYPTVNGFQLSNFVTPMWFDPNGKAPYDFLKQCTKPGQLLKGGYISIFNNGQWTQKFGSKEAESKFNIENHHRVRKINANNSVIPKKDNKKDKKDNKKTKKVK